MNLRKQLQDLRRTLHESIGSDRYSRPGLNDLDNKLSKYLNFRNGVFIEAGGNDGFTQSNTYRLEKTKGWTGVLVEGIPELYEKARRRRSRSKVFNNALVPFGSEGTEVEMVYGNLMSIVVGAMGTTDADEDHIRKSREHEPAQQPYRVKVPGRTLSSIIDEAGLQKIDFFSLDVEGFEAPVLRGIDFKRHRPTLILVEARFPAQIDEILGSYYEVIDHPTKMDVLYRLRK